MPPLVPPPAGAEALPPERAAPPSRATAQPDRLAAAIIPATSATEQALTAPLASTFTGIPVWWRRQLRTPPGKRVDELPLFERGHVAPSRDLIAGAQAAPAIARGAKNANIDAR